MSILKRIACLSIMDKGCAERELLTLPAEAKKAIERWLGFRNAIDPNAALFVSLSSGMAERSISGSGVYHLITTLGQRVGVKARPHGLRHTAVTEALNVYAPGAGADAVRRACARRA